MNRKMNRKILPILLIFTMILSLLGINPVSYAFVATDFNGGSGSEADPWQIATAVQLNNVRYYLGPEHADQYFILTADIDLGVYPFNDGEGWKPLGKFGTTSEFFYGNFDGGGKIISNLFIDMSDITISGDNPAGLFGVVLNGTIRNITLENVDVTGYECVGGLVGDPESSYISDSLVTGSVIGKNYIGGLAGYSYETYIANTSFIGSVTGGYDVGGLVGSLYYGSIRNSISKGFVNGNCEVGGLVGNSDNSSVFQSHSESLVTGIYDGPSYSTEIGGLVGYNYSNSTINQSYATGGVSGTDVVGGLVGENLSSSKVINAYAWGNVSSDADDIDKIVGGLVGETSGSSTIENCYAVGVVSGTGDYHGGLVGYNYADNPIISSYSLGPENGEGSVVTPEQMQLASTFVGWNFNDIWAIDEGYPHLLPSGVAEIVSLKDSSLYVPIETPLSDVKMPFMVFATLDDTIVVPMRVTWDTSNSTYDGYTAGDYPFTGTITSVDGITNNGGYTANLIVTVRPQDKEITSVESLTDIKVPIGTDYYQIGLPSSVVVTLDDLSTTSLEVTWEADTLPYDSNTPGNYTFKGIITTVMGIANTDDAFASVTVIVETPPDTQPVILNQPEDESVKVGESTSFSVGYTAKPDPSLQWQFSKNGGKRWTDIPGANSSTFEVTQVTIEMNGTLYRVILDNGIETPVTSNAAKLTVTSGTADLKISQPGGIYDPVTKEIVWSVRVYNDGPDRAQGVVIKNTLANAIKLLSVKSAYGSSVKGKTVTVNVGDMEANTEIVIEIRVLVTRITSPITNTATVTSTSLDLDLESNSSSSDILIQ